MEIAAQIATKLHLISAIYWTGAMLFLAAVATPLLDIVRPPSFQRELSRRFWMLAHRSMWIAIAVLVVSGAFMLYRAGQISAQMFSMQYLLSPIGNKIVITGAMIFLALLHDLFLGPGARMRDPKASTDPPGLIGRAIPWIVALGAISAALISSQIPAP